jgi:hypothetical protein
MATRFPNRLLNSTLKSLKRISEEPKHSKQPNKHKGISPQLTKYQERLIGIAQYITAFAISIRYSIHVINIRYSIRHTHSL